MGHDFFSLKEKLNLIRMMSVGRTNERNATWTLLGISITISHSEFSPEWAHQLSEMGKLYRW